MEIIETAANLADSGRNEMLVGEPADRAVQLIDVSERLLRRVGDDFLTGNLENFSARLKDRLRSIDPKLME
ncbi:hypothetical protein [Streptomyces sp. NPDC046805]|uniref:hypothetical protein n=1 Tax=Streptomyces sp. NPDC046805 TaxID=3155134 RepID=UPI0033CC1947